MKKILSVESDEREKEIKQSRRRDNLFIFLPIALAAIIFIGVPIFWMIKDKVNGESGIGGFDLNGLLVIAGMFIWAVFCVVYGLVAFVHIRSK